jgi:two-component system cell cycle sensor histidine kinase/response regulator CckA
VAHDFNNMLTVISGYNRMILDELSTLDPLRGYAEEILKAADRAGALTNQLLAFSRRQIMQPRVINVNAVMLQTQKMLQRLIGEDVELVLKLGVDVGNIKADPGHVEQAIVNLAVNARDAMPLGGRLTIETANVTLDENYARTHMGVKPGDFTMIAVSDNGHGMDAETRRHIFEPFFTTKEKGKGTGLGLATVYGMVKQAGGDIWVYSEPGKGTTFKLYFPRVLEPCPNPPGRWPPSARRSGGETILVVEDEQAVRDLTVRILQQLGYTILTASSGAEALEISQAHAGHIDLLLTDVVMPNMSGRQLADHIQAARPRTKVLFLSGYTENTVVHHGVLDAGVDFLPKPFSRENLSRKLREVLATAGSARPSGIEPASRRCRGRAASGNKGRAEKPRRRPRKSRSTGLNGGRAASAHPAADPSSRHWRAVNQPASAPRNDVGRHGIGKDSSSAGSANSGADCAGGNEKRAGSGTSGRAAAHRPPRCRRLRSAGYRANFHSSRILAHRGE